MLTQNKELRKDHIFNWTLPAWVVRVTSGKAVNVYLPILFAACAGIGPE